MTRIASWLLHRTEVLFLYAHGWRRVPNQPDLWTAPASHSKAGRLYRGGHALNSQKYYDRVVSLWGSE